MQYEDEENYIKEHVESMLNDSLSSEIYIIPRFLSSIFSHNFFENYFIDVYSIENTKKFFEDAIDDTKNEMKELKEGWEDFKDSFKESEEDVIEDEEIYDQYIDSMTDLQQASMLWARGENFSFRKKASQIYSLEEFVDILNCMDEVEGLRSSLDYFLEELIPEEFNYIFNEL